MFSWSDGVLGMWMLDAKNILCEVCTYEGSGKDVSNCSHSSFWSGKLQNVSYSLIKEGVVRVCDKMDNSGFEDPRSKLRFDAIRWGRNKRTGQKHKRLDFKLLVPNCDMAGINQGTRKKQKCLILTLLVPNFDVAIIKQRRSHCN